MLRTLFKRKTGSAKVILDFTNRRPCSCSVGVGYTVASKYIPRRRLRPPAAVVCYINYLCQAANKSVDFVVEDHWKLK